MINRQTVHFTITDGAITSVYIEEPVVLAPVDGAIQRKENRTLRCECGRLSDSTVYEGERLHVVCGCGVEWVVEYGVPEVVIRGPK